MIENDRPKIHNLKVLVNWHCVNLHCSEQYRIYLYVKKLLGLFNGQHERDE